mmetsp:Transcript_20162/g.17855  ORF Transcript_20162/g.17855 Transcript_20162/m.17855 type:complete len:514 (+) Transcript_20162:47-1588(+)
MAFERGHDSLNLSDNSSCLKMLRRYGDNHPNTERVILSVRLIKINKKEKEQDRILLLTDKALYNLKPRQLKKPQRRIDYKLIESISISTISDEMTVHSLTEYDYRFKTSHKNHISNVLSGLATKVNGKIIPVNTLIVFDLSHVTINKEDAKEMTMEERIKIIESCDTTQRNTIENETMEFVGKCILSEDSNSFDGPNPVNQVEIPHNKITQNPIYENQTRLRNLTSARQEKLNLRHIYRSYCMFSQQSMTRAASLTDDNDKLLVDGYVRSIYHHHYHFSKNMNLNIMNINLISKIMDYCLLYYCAIFDSFSNGIIHHKSNRIKVGNNKLAKTIHGSYCIPCDLDNNNNYTYLWKLRVNSIDRNAVLFLGIDNDINTHFETSNNFIERNDTMNYGFGGPVSSVWRCKTMNSKSTGYNLWSQNKICGETGVKFERGDHIEIILDLNKKALIFVINAGKHYVLNGINTNIKNGYKLAMHLVGACITLEDFIMYNASYYDVIGSSVDMKNSVINYSV